VLNFPPAVRIWLGTAPVDLRRSFDGLAEQVRQHLQNDPLSGHVFVFPWPAAAEGQASVALRAAELAMLLDGIDWSTARRGRRYHRQAATG
jgi:transposase